MMTPREIIARAWVITRKERMLRRWGYVAALLRTLLNAKLFIYQAWLVYSYFQGKPIGFFTIEELLFEHLPTWFAITIYVTFVLLLLVEWIFPHLAKGAIIGLGAKSYRGEEVKGGLVLALYNFFAMFALHEMLVISGLPMAITLISLALRYLSDAGKIAAIIIAILWIVSVILEFFWIFAEEAVVVRKVGVKQAIKRSFKLVISYLGQIVFLILLMFMILLRFVLNVLMIVLVPAVIMGVGFVLTTFLSTALSYSIATILGLGIIVVASYFFAYLEVFRQNVWTITYIELSSQKELDLIEKE